MIPKQVILDHLDTFEGYEMTPEEFKGAQRALERTKRFVENYIS